MAHIIDVLRLRGPDHQHVADHLQHRVGIKLFADEFSPRDRVPRGSCMGARFGWRIPLAMDKVLGRLSSMLGISSDDLAENAKASMKRIKESS